MGPRSSRRRNRPWIEASRSIGARWMRALAPSSWARQSSRSSESTTERIMLNEKVVVVTGGGGLLGRHFCREIARSGGVAIVADVNLDAAKSVAAEIKATKGRAEAAEI